MELRNSTLFLSVTTALVLLTLALVGHSVQARSAAVPLLERKAKLVRELELTDLCLFTEASYTRHPAMTDLVTPFQEAPFAFEHFPSGSLVGPPERLVRNHGRRD